MKSLRNKDGKFSFENLYNNILEALDKYKGKISHNELVSELHIGILNKAIGDLINQGKVKMIHEPGFGFFYIRNSKS